MVTVGTWGASLVRFLARKVAQRNSQRAGQPDSVTAPWGFSRLDFLRAADSGSARHNLLHHPS